MSSVQVIVECSKEKENILSGIGTLKYKIPIINSYVIEVPEEMVERLKGIEGVKAVHQSSIISAQMNAARKAINVERVQSMGITGRGITVAVLDTGVCPVPDITMPRNRILAFKDFILDKKEAYDDNGHGTHVAGIVAGNGHCSNGKYMGIAPDCNVVAIKILDEEGRGTAGNVLAGVQWLVDNKELYDIKVANLSIGTMDIGSKDPLVRAVEAAWDLGIVMIIAAGNNGPEYGTVTSPGISRKAITVGASDDNKSVRIWGSTLKNFSGRGPTSECIIKPDVIAPGADIISCMPLTMSAEEASKRGLEIVDDHYIKMSGTSMAAPIISGAAALLLQKHPELNPDEIKYRIKNSSISLNYSQNQQGWGLIDIEKFIE